MNFIICQQGNIILDNLSVLGLVRMSRSHVKGHRCGVVYVLWILPVTPKRRAIFSLQFVCVCVCLSVCLSVCPALFLWTKFQPNDCGWMWFSLNSCLLHWLEPYRNWWPWVEGQGHCDRKCIKKWWTKFAKNSTINIFENKSSCSIDHFIAVILIPNMSIL